MANFGFDVTEVEASSGGNDFEVMPKGEYKLKATEAEGKETQKGGYGINVTFEVVTPSQYNGRKVWQWFNTKCTSEKAEKIGREQIAGWARAAGKPNARDTDELLERAFSCKLDIEIGTGGYKDKNKIVGFLTPDQAGKPAAAPAPKAASKFEDVPAPKQEAAPEPTPKVETPTETPTATPTTTVSEAPPAGAKKKPWEN